MSGRILIVDSIPTNRIVMRVKMLAAQFKVDTCANRQEAEELIAQCCPDLILMNLCDNVEDRHAFCKDLKTDPRTKSIAVISIGVSDTAQARFASLDAGADDVMPRPINDALMLARIRSLLRIRHAKQELMLRDGTSRALGFDEAQHSFDAAPHITLISPAQQTIGNIFITYMSGRVSHIDSELFQKEEMKTSPDLVVIDASADRDGGRRMFRMIADLRARQVTRLSSLMVILADDTHDIAALALDLGADDVCFTQTSTGEFKLRAKALIRQKQAQDRLRNTVRNGLRAAVTDPLTGLYNRRYVDPHLERMADQARMTQREFAVMILDIDHFKQINDRYGHMAGDKVLVEIARRLQNYAGDIDLVARIGGEEFLLARPDTDNAQAQKAADKLRTLISERPFALGPDQPMLRVTMSVGVAIGGLSHLDRGGIDQLCDRADAALYAAKSSGRDAVAICGHGMTGYSRTN